jgi:ubiquinone biosynthesis monooxygenase Coq7
MGARRLPRPFSFSMPLRFHGLLDPLLIAADEALRTLSGAGSASRPMPSAETPRTSDADRRHSAGLMRVNHTGEICAQALYSGQTLFARDPRVRDALRQAASEERDHLSWCRTRLEELGSGPSLLDPFWYASSFALGAASGLAGDRWSMGFLAETEAQVERHLEGHLESLPPDDGRSRAVVAQMRDDEARHGSMGRALGAAELPEVVKRAMQATARVMTRTAYRV